jgi:hypothetical protein
MLPSIMRKILNDILFFSIMFSLSCNTKQETEKVSQNISTEVFVEKREDSINAINETVQQERTLPLLYFEDFRSLCETSDMLGKSKWSKFYNPTGTGGYGNYSIFKKGLAGWLTVHTPREDGDNWRMDDTDQTFISISLYDFADLRLFDSVHIGANVRVLENTLGEPKLRNDSLYVYWDSNWTIGIFHIKGKKIEQIIYGRYNKEEIKLPLTNAEIRRIER